MCINVHNIAHPHAHPHAHPQICAMWKDHPDDPSTPDVFAGAGVPEKGDAVQKNEKKRAQQS